MAQPIETLYLHTPPRLDGEYSQVKTLGEKPISQFVTEFGSIALHTIDIQLTREYENDDSRTTQYEVLAAYRTDVDAPNQSDYPVVHYSNALLTTPRKPGTATNRYLLNPVYEGFSAINVSVKQKPRQHGIGKLARISPHTIPLEEMADDEIIGMRHVADTLGLGQSPGQDGLVHFNKSGYSRGTQLSLVQIARAGLHGMVVDRLHGRGPGPINHVAFHKIARGVLKELGQEGRVIGRQLRQDPIHAINNYLNVVSHHGDEIMSYVGDADALLQGEVSKAMPFINPDLRGYMTIFTHDAFGRHKDYSVHFDQLEDTGGYRSLIAPGLRLIHLPGAHMSGMDSSQVKRDRLEWKAERVFLDGHSDAPTSFAS